MKTHHGHFCWYELMTTDTAAAAAFYGRVVGWTAREAGQPGTPYTLLLMDDHRVAGLMALPEDARAAGVPPGWLGYVAVDDVDRSATQVNGLGGSIEYGPSDIPEVGRFALARDPQGAAFVLFKGVGDMDAPEGVTPPGFGAWRELYSSDHEAAFTFYSTLFGWTQSAAVDMGPMGVYQLFAHDGTDIGGMMTKPPAMPVSAWGYYFQVDAIDPAIRRIEEARGAVVHGPAEVPGGQWIVQGRDPQGAMFALVSAHR